MHVTSQMPLNTNLLERAGIHVSAEELEAYVNVALESLIPPYRAPRALDVLPRDERAFWDTLGVDLDAEPRGVAPEVQSAVRLASLWATSLTPQDAAKRLGVDRSLVSRRVASHSLYAVQQDGHFRLPLFQFTDDQAQVIPGVQVIAPYLAGVHPISVFRWFTSPHPDLIVGEDEESLSPRDWLLSGGNPASLVASAQHLGDPGAW